MKLKDKIAIAQAIVTNCGILVGGRWAYSTFIRERKFEPRATLEHKISHIRLDPKTNLLRVSLTIKNTGSAPVEIRTTDIRVQQVSPVFCVKGDPKCTTKEIAESLESVNRITDIFSGPMIGRRKTNRRPISLAAGEIVSSDFEFIIPTDVKAVRIYSYLRNERFKRNLGWANVSYHEFPNSMNKDNEQNTWRSSFHS